MAIEVTIPRLGWSMDEGTFGAWLKVDGEFVQAGEAIFTLESDKAVQEVESVDAGVLKILPNAPQSGDTVTVGTLVAYLAETGEDDLPTSSAAGVEVAVVPAAPRGSQSNDQASAESTSTANSHRAGLKISPRAKRLAGQLTLDWTRLTGSGKSGRIRERDVRAAAADAPATKTPALVPATGRVRRAIAARMMYSVHNTAPVTLTRRIDATNLVGLRDQFKTARQEFVPAYQDIIAKLAALALQTHPQVRRQWADDELVEPDGIHIGIAVDTDAGLLVPVIRDCDRLSLGELTRRSRERIERARAGKCSAADLSGGTFTITNLGAVGIEAFTPIINSPETAILGLGAIRREAVVLEDDRIVPRWQMTLSLTFDHRAVDGAPAARFLQTLSASIENPGPSLIG